MLGYSVEYALSVQSVQTFQILESRCEEELLENDWQNTNTVIQMLNSCDVGYN